ncbi:unnamed protein product [Paramecium sonneborni]|uniref:Uncharacterized protein n=1 Tax=Paramecium sonneborni TaxID=65129 RepID=A0A8S1RET8_9CILI|nr:unnamed protein product [Paramecium sonneborni]
MYNYITTLNTEEEEQQHYQLILRKLNNPPKIQRNLNIIQKNNEDDRKYLSISSNVYQLNQSQEDDTEQLRQQINFLHDELSKSKQNMMQIIEELTQERHLLIFKIQVTIDNLQQQKQLRNKSIHSTQQGITNELNRNKKIRIVRKEFSKNQLIC